MFTDLLISSKKEIPRFRPKSIRHYGNAMLLHKAMRDLLPLLKEGVDELWEEIYALATVRILGYVSLKRMGSVWERLYDPNEFTPNLSPKKLSGVLSSHVLRASTLQRLGTTRITCTSHR